MFKIMILYLENVKLCFIYYIKEFRGYVIYFEEIFVKILSFDI